MTEREKQLEKYIVEYALNTAADDRKKFERIMTENSSGMLKEILRVFNGMFQKAADGDFPKEVSFLIISYLNSGILNGQIELKIDLLDKTNLFDENPITEYCTLHYFDEAMKEDFENFEKFIETKMIRVRYQELYRYKRACMIKYMSLVEDCMTEFAMLIPHLKSFQTMKKTADFKIVYGELTSKGSVLYEGNGEMP